MYVGEKQKKGQGRLKRIQETGGLQDQKWGHCDAK